MKRPRSLEQRRIMAHARTLGVDPDQLTSAVRVSYLVWRMRLPWRLLPPGLRCRVFVRFFGGWANRFVASWINGVA